MFLVVLLLLWCAVYVVWWCMRPRHPTPPVLPGVLPLIGHAHMLIGDALHFWKFEQKMFNFALKNGGIIEIRFGPHPVYVITDPDDSVILANKCLEKPYFYSFAKEMFNRGLVTASLSTWKPHRRLLNPAFGQKVLNTFVSEYNLQARNLVSLLATEVDKDPFNVHRYLINNLLHTVCQTSLGLNKQENNMINKDYALATEHLISLFIERLQKVWLHLPYIFSWSSLKKKQDRLTKITNEIMKSVIKERKLELKAIGLESDEKSTSDKFKPLLNQMLDLADKQVVFTDDEIREHLDTIVTAAYDTTATAITYTLVLIGSYPDMQERIYQEIQTVLGNQDRDLTKDDLPKLVFLDAVLKESLRLYPPVPTVARSICSDVQLRNYKLPAGSSCLISVYGINRHPVWGADAEQFRPERWLDPTTLPDNPNAFATFSLGRRNCIGKLYGMMTMKTTLAHILRKYYIIGDVSKIQTQCDIMIKPFTDKQICIKRRTCV